jgi:hypothetical protein
VAVAVLTTGPKTTERAALVAEAELKLFRELMEQTALVAVVAVGLQTVMLLVKVAMAVQAL